MDRDITQFQPREGMEVYGADDEKIGEVDTAERDYFVVRKGFFFPEDHYIPVDAVASFDDDRVYLRYTKDQVLEQQWTSPPGTATTADYDATDYDTDVVRERDIADREDVTIPVHEEDLVVRTREVERGTVEVTKRVVEEEESVDVPVTEERVEVSRRAVDRDVPPGEDAFQEETIEIPVRGEAVEVDKEARVVEEVEVDRTATERTEHVTDTVRREEVEVEGEDIDRDVDRDRGI